VRDILQELRQLERQAGAIHDVFVDANAKSPSRAEGTDQTGTVRVVVDAEGLPAEIVVARDWHDVLAGSEFGRAVRDAFTDATRSRMAIWSQAIATSGWRDRVEDLRDGAGRLPSDAAGTSGVVAPSVAAWRRPFEDVLGDVLRDDDPVATAPAPTGTGWDESGQLVLTVAPSGLVSCVASAHWLSYQNAEALTTALAQAVGSARAELSAATRAIAPDGGPERPAERHARLFDEVLARLGELRRLSES
jgi:hypothetical protein